MKLTEKETEILEILDENSRADLNTIAKMAGVTTEEAEAIIQKLEDQKVIIDYSTMIDWRKVDGHEGVTAMIDVKVTPKEASDLMKLLNVFIAFRKWSLSISCQVFMIYLL